MINQEKKKMATTAAVIIAAALFSGCGNILKKAAQKATEEAIMAYVLSEAQNGNLTVENGFCDVKTVAGSYPTKKTGYVDATGTASRFQSPINIAIQKSSGTIYIADEGNHVIRKMTSAAVVSTFAGVDQSPYTDLYVNGDAQTQAIFYRPNGVAVDSAGNVFVADRLNHAIRKISGGVVSTLAGPSETLTVGVSGYADGTGTASRFYEPNSIAIDSSNNVFVRDPGNCVIRKITPAGVVTTLAGKAGNCGDANGSGSAARFDNVHHGLAVNSAGEIFTTNRGDLKKITPKGEVSVFLSKDALPGTKAGGNIVMYGIAFDSQDNLFVNASSAVYMISPSGKITLAAGNLDEGGYLDGYGKDARFQAIRGIAVGKSGIVYVSEIDNLSIRKLTCQQ